MVSLHEFPVYAVLPCSDYERARGWYQGKLGLKPAVPEMPGNGWFQCADGTWFILTTSAHAGTAENTAAGFTVKGIETVMDQLRSNGVEFQEYDMGEIGKTVNGLFIMAPYNAAWFKDSEGNLLELSEVLS